MKTPWHLWVIGIASLLFNAGGAFDYVMTQTRNVAYMGQFTPEQLDYFYSFPTWTVAAWAIAVWGAVAGSCLLLLCRRWAVWAYGLSLLSMLASAVQNFALSEVKMQDVVGLEALVISGVIAVISIALVYYAWLMARRGVLR